MYVWLAASRIVRQNTRLGGHAVLHRNTSAQRLHTLDIAIADRLAVIEEPVQAVNRNLSIDFFMDVQSSLDRLVVCRVQTKWPPILYEVFDDGFQFAFHHGQHVRPRDKEVFEVRSGETSISPAPFTR